MCRHQFDSCSYEELTDCIHARVQWIRDCRKFLKDTNTLKYGYIRTIVAFKLATNNAEIRRLLKMRRVLKKSDLKNWSDDRLGALI